MSEPNSPPSVSTLEERPTTERNGKDLLIEESREQADFLRTIEVKEWWRELILRKLREENKGLSEWNGPNFYRLLGRVVQDQHVVETVQRNEEFKLTRELQKYLYKEMLKVFDTTK